MAAEVLSQHDWACWSLNQLSREFGIARETVSKRLFDAGIKPAGDRHGHPTYRVGDAATAILRPQQQTPTGYVADPEKLPPDERKKWYEGNLAKRKDEIEAGRYVDVEAVRNEWGKVLRIVGEMLDVIPDKLERKCQLPPEALIHVENIIDAIRNDLGDIIEQDLLPGETADLFNRADA